MPFLSVRIAVAPLLCLAVLVSFSAIFPDNYLPPWIANQKQNFRSMICKSDEPLSIDEQECIQWFQEIEGRVRAGFVDILRKSMRKIGELLALNPQADFDNVFNFTEEREKLNETAAALGEAMINKMKFSEYDESNLCDVWKGVEVSEFDGNVDAVADFANLPENLTIVIKKAKKFRIGRASALNKLTFRDKLGNLVFGRFVIAKSGDHIDFAYSLHSVRYVAKKQLTEETVKYAAQLQKLADSMNKNDADSIGQITADATDTNDITIAQRNAYLAFFHKKAIDTFSVVCTDMAKKIFHDDDFALGALGITKEKDGKGNN